MEETILSHDDNGHMNRMGNGDGYDAVVMVLMLMVYSCDVKVSIHCFVEKPRSRMEIQPNNQRKNMFILLRNLHKFCIISKALNKA